jgi:predicted nucleic acid-binding protein
MFLPDINFWLALTFEVHAHHVRAKEFFDTHPADQFSFCRFTQQGFLRIASNATVFHKEAVSLAVPPLVIREQQLPSRTLHLTWKNLLLV